MILSAQLRLALGLCLLTLERTSGARNDLWSIVRLKAEERMKRGVCLDGSAPAYYWREGWGSGADKFLLHYEGGGWCLSDQDCLSRSKTPLGSSRTYPPVVDLNGALGCYFSNDSSSNPLLHNWNIAFFKYCDGSSFSGDVQTGVNVDGTTIYYRGKQVNDALLKDLVEKRGFRKAAEVVVSGCSAGGLAVYLHVDGVAQVLEGSGAKVRGLADSGFFLDENLNGSNYSQTLKWLVGRQKVSTGVNQKCIEAFNDTHPRHGAYHCFSAQYFMRHVATPTFSLMSKFDMAQISVDHLNIHDEQQINDAGEMMEAIYLHSYRDTDVRHGWLLDGCAHHCYWTGVGVNETFDPWNNVRGPSGRSQRQIFEEWYTDDRAVDDVKYYREQSDGVFPCKECCFAQ